LTRQRTVANNAGVLRTFVALALSVAVQVAAAYAPLVHAHPDDHDTGHHKAHAVHAHVTGHALHAHPHGGPAVGEDDHDRAVFLDSFVAVSAAPLLLSAAVPSVFELADPAEMPAHRTAHVAHGHDPPFHRSLPSRAPPALLS
jgi:hypothetical protein